MLKTPYFALLSAIVVCLLEPALASGVNDSRLQRLKFREDQYTQATLRKDTALIAKVLSPDFFDTTSHAHVIRKPQYLKKLSDPSWHMNNIKVWDQTYLVHGDSAVVAAQYRMIGTENGHAFDHEGRSTDVWVWEDGDWWCVAAHSSLENS